MSANANIRVSWLHPSLSGGMISVRGISAFAFVPALTERLLDYQSAKGMFAGFRVHCSQKSEHQRLSPYV
jgi:hypothetical protein